MDINRNDDHAQQREEGAGQCRIFVPQTAFDRQSADVGSEGVSEVEGHLHKGGTEHFSAARILEDQQLLWRRDTEEASRRDAHQRHGQNRHAGPEENPHQGQRRHGQRAAHDPFGREAVGIVAADTELPKMENAHFVMKRIVNAVRDRFDYIFIDCSPSLGYTTVNILTAADSVLIPVQCEYLALEGLSKLLNTIRKIKSTFNPALEIEGFLLTMYMRNRLNNQVVTEVREHFGDLAYDTIIQRNIRLGEAPSHGKPVMLYDAGAVGSENYLNLAREFLKRNRKKRN